MAILYINPTEESNKSIMRKREHLNRKLAFKDVLQNYLGSDHSFSFWKGRVALYAILQALNIRPADEIIVPGYTCVMNVNPIKYLQAIPVYVDIDPISYNISTNLIEERITKKTRLIIAQHTYGYPCEIDKILELGAKYNIPVIEDCCLALGSTYKGRFTGSFGVASYFSFQWNKPITTGLGGIALTSDKQLAAAMTAICNQKAIKPCKIASILLTLQFLVYRAFIYPRTVALAQTIFRYLTRKGLVLGSSAPEEYKPIMPSGFFTEMGWAQNRAGIMQMNKLSHNIAHRKKMKVKYDELLSVAGYTPLHPYPDKSDPVLVRYPIRIRNKNLALSEAATSGIELGSWFECPLHPIETPMDKYDYLPGSCPEAEKAAKEVVNLPLHPRADEKTAKKTIAFLQKYL